MRIRGKRRVSVVAYIVIAFGVCIGALGAVMAMTTSSSFRRERARTSAELRTAAQYNADAAAAIPQTLQFLAGLAVEPGISSLDPARCTAALSGLAVFAQSGNVWVLRPDGSTVCELSAGNPSAPVMPAGDWVGRAQSSPNAGIGDLFLDPRTGRPESTMFAPITGGAAIIAVFDAAMIEPITAPPNAAKEMVLIELDGTRKVVVAASASAPVKAGPVLAGSWLRHPLGAQHTRSDPDGVTRLYQEVRAEGIDRYMLAGVPVGVALAGAKHELNRNLEVALLVVLLVTLLGALMQRQIARPVRKLKKVIVAAAGDHLVRAVPEGPAEIAAVAEAFNTTMSERRQLELDLATALKQAQKASRLKSEFLANMSHEIRTPMNGVLGMLSLLREIEMADETREYVTTMSESADSLMSILNDLLDFSKLEAGMLQAEAEPFGLRECVSHAISPWVAIADAKGVSLSADIPADLGDMVVGDRLRLRQILSNLIDNAVKFTNRGWIIVRVERDEKGKARFEVADSGIGISPEGREHLFEPFVQADGTNTRRYGGTGLGLAICRQLADFMGGSIGVESTQGVGSKFWFVLPLPVAEDKTATNGSAVVRPTDAPVQAAQPSPATRATATPRVVPSTPTASPTGEGRRVLVVEDNLINQKVAMQMLRKLGYDPSVAADGIEAVRAAEADNYDLVLMDIQMPVMDGYEATIELRRRGVTIPIIAMTASALGEDRERCTAVGMDGYISKPVTTDSIANELTRVLKAHAGPITV